MESRDAFDRRRLLAGDRGQRQQGVALAQLERACRDADERMARQPLAFLDAFQEEARLARRAQQAVRADRGEHVGEDLSIDRDERMVLRKRPRFLAGGSAVSHLFLYPLSLAMPRHSLWWRRSANLIRPLSPPGERVRVRGERARPFSLSSLS